MITDIVFTLASYAVQFLVWSIFLWAILSLLMAFNVLDRRNRFIWAVTDFLDRIVEPVLRPVRRFVPSFNGVDLSPWITLVLLQVVVVRLLDYLHIGIRYGVWPPLF